MRPKLLAILLALAVGGAALAGLLVMAGLSERLAARPIQAV
jgi:hypothetical protein